MSTNQDKNGAAPRDVPMGTTVIYAGSGGTYRYDGSAATCTGMVGTIAVSFGKEPSGLKCAPERVAPADTPIPERSDRVAVVKRPVGKYPTWKGPWRLTVDGEYLGFHRTKRDATATGLRVVAIADWHAAGVTDA